MRRRLTSLLLILAMVLTILPFGAVSAEAVPAEQGTLKAGEPVVTGQPKNATAKSGESVSFHVTASGDNLTYRWQYRTPEGEWTYSGADGARTDTLSIVAAVSRDGFQYRCAVTGNGKTVYSNAATLTVKATITAQPKNVTAHVGETATFTVKAVGTELVYRWQVDSGSGWKNSGQTGCDTPTLSVPVTVSRDGYRYRCVVTDANGKKAISDAATLTVRATVTAQPKNVSAKVGETAQFTVKAAGVDITYRWQYRTSADGTWKNSGAAGHDTAALSIPVGVSREGYQYRCVVTDKYGRKAISDPATLTVLATVNGQPKDVSAQVGDTAKFTVKAAGVGMTYKWQYRASAGDAWSYSGAEGAKTDTLSIPVTAKRNGYQYRCVITDAHGKKTYSDAATLTVKTTVTTQPEDVYLPVGETAAFTVAVTGAGLTYQWQYRGIYGDWKNSTSTGNKTAALSLKIDGGWDDCQFRCRITDANGNTTYSDAATLMVKLVITDQPQSVKLPRGKTAEFTVKVSGGGRTYQWQYRTSASGTWSNSGLTGCKTETLSVPVDNAHDGYQYSCVITDRRGVSIRSDAATLTVNPYRANGRCGDNLTWTLSYEGVLTVSGTGDMWDESNINPWHSVRSEIRKVVIGDGVTSIKSYAFFQTDVSSLTLGKGLKTIGVAAFREAMDLREVTLPDGLETIGTSAFKDTNLKSVIIPDSVTTIGSGAFGGCWQITSIRFPSGLKRIEGGVLAYCSSLKSITIPETVEYIGEAAFRGCTGITTLVIPKSVKSISYYAMANCDKMATVKFMGAAPQMPANIFRYDVETHSIKVYYPSAYASSWNEVHMQSFGRMVEWIPY